MASECPYGLKLPGPAGEARGFPRLLHGEAHANQAATSKQAICRAKNVVCPRVTSPAGAGSYESLLQFPGIRINKIVVGARPSGRYSLYLRCLTISYRHIPVATDTLRLETVPCIGRLTSSSQRSAMRLPIPRCSLPITRATDPRKSTS